MPQRFAQLVLGIAIPVLIWIVCWRLFWMLALGNLLTTICASIVAAVVSQSGLQAFAKFTEEQTPSWSATTSFCLRRAAIYLAIPLGLLLLDIASYRLHLVVPSVLVMFAAGVIVWLLVRRIEANEKDDAEIVQGQPVVPMEKVKQAIDRSVPKGADTIQWGPLQLPADGRSHFAVVGTTGSGKTTLINLLMRSALKRINRRRNTRALVFDAKRNVVSKLYGMGLQCPVILLNPFDSRSYAWDISEDVDSDERALDVALTLFPENNTSGEQHFDEAARLVFASVMQAFVRRGQPWTLHDVLTIMRRHESIMEHVGGFRDLREEMATLFGREQILADTMTSIMARIRRYSIIAKMWSQASEKISLRRWAEMNAVLVLGIDQRARQELDRVNCVLFKMASKVLQTNAPDSRQQTWVFIDELIEAGKLPGLDSFMRLGREYGVRLVLGLQSIEGLEKTELYGDKGAQEVLHLCSNTAILKLDSGPTADWASQKLGAVLRREQMKTRSQNSTSTQEQLNKRDNVLPSELMAIPQPRRTGELRGYLITDGMPSFMRLPKSELANLPKSSLLHADFKARKVPKVLEERYKPTPTVRADSVASDHPPEPYTQRETEPVAEVQQRKPSIFDFRRRERYHRDD